MFDFVIDCSDRIAKNDLLHRIGTLQGLTRVRLTDARRTRTNAQSRYYFGVICRALKNYLAEQGQVFDSDQVHEMLKHQFLMREVCDKKTGEVIGYVTGSTAKLNVEEFSRYVDQCSLWLNEFFGIVLPDASIYESPT